MNRKQLCTNIKEKDCKKDLLCKLAQYVEKVARKKFCDIKQHYQHLFISIDTK